MPDFKQTFQEEVRRLARKELKALDVNTLTPIEAMEKLYSLCKHAKELS